MKKPSQKMLLILMSIAMVSLTNWEAFGQKKNQKPNILVIMEDYIGIPNISCLSFGIMGYKTPNIDRIAKEGIYFTDYYAEQSCTAGRSAFIILPTISSKLEALNS